MYVNLNESSLSLSKLFSYVRCQIEISSRHKTAARVIIIRRKAIIQLIIKRSCRVFKTCLHMKGRHIWLQPDRMSLILVVSQTVYAERPALSVDASFSSENLSCRIKDPLVLTFWLAVLATDHRKVDLILSSPQCPPN